MDNWTEELQQSYDEAFARLVMKEYVQRYGEQIWQEYEAAVARGEIEEFCPKVDEMVQKLIESTKPKKPKRVLRLIGLVAAIVIFAFAIALGAEAAGFRVFGRAAWTDDSLKILDVGQEENAAKMVSYEPEERVVAGFKKLSIPIDFMPSKIPEGYTVSHVETIVSSYISSVNILFTGSEGENFTVHFERFGKDFSSLEDCAYSKDKGDVEIYIANGRDYYVYQNNGEWCAVWANNKFSVVFSSLPTKSALYGMIDSIQTVVKK